MSTYMYLGEAITANLFELYIPQIDVKHRKTERHRERLAIAAMHELIHCARFERFPDWGPLELVAHEGLAYVFGDAAATELNSKLYKPLGKVLLGISPEHIDNLQRQMLADLDTKTDDEIYKAWMHFSEVEHLSKGEVIGITRVSEQLANGQSASDLLSMPAEELLGLG